MCYLGRGDTATDADAADWIKIFSFLDQPTISGLIEAHQKDASKRSLQKALAKEVTIFIHGEEEYLKAVETTEKLFSNQNAAAENLSEADLESIEGVITIDYPAARIKAGTDVISFLAETTIFPSKGEARKTVQGGGVSINRKKVEGLELTVDSSLLLHQKYILVQKGKKNYYLVIAG